MIQDRDRIYWFVSRLLEDARAALRPVLILALGGAVGALAGCGEDQGSAAAPSAQAPTASTGTPAGSSTGGSATHLNLAPSIAGAPPGSVVYGQGYSFKPTALDPEGGTLKFSIVNKPPWATFDSATGTLAGTPQLGDIGVYAGISITVTDGVYLVTLPAFQVSVVGTATGAITLSWMPPTQREDGTPLTDLAGYKVYWGTTLGSYANSISINNAGVVSYVIEQLVPGKYYLTATAFDSKGIESTFSNVVAKTVL